METLNLRPIEKAKIDCARTFRGLGYGNNKTFSVCSLGGYAGTNAVSYNLFV